MYPLAGRDGAFSFSQARPKRWLSAGLGILLLFAHPCTQAAEPSSPQLRVERAGPSIEVSLPRLEAAETYELRLVTSGIRELETGEQIAETGVIYLPPPESGVAPVEGALYFFFHDLADAADWELVATFPAGSTGEWVLNGPFVRHGGQLSSEIVVPGGELLRGENLLYVRSGSAIAPQLYYRRVLKPASRSPVQVSIVPLDWEAEVSLWTVGAPPRQLARTIIEPLVLQRYRTRVPDEFWTDRAYLQEAALRVGENLLRSRVGEENVRLRDGFNLVYDVNRAAYRIPHWIWSWGPSITLLYELHDLAAATGEHEQAREFLEAGTAAARRSLDFERREPGHPADGVTSVRWEVSGATPNGYIEYLSTADSLFLAGWGWMAAYERTRDEIFLQRTRDLARTAERLMKEYSIVPQDWIVERDRWTPHTLDESVFGMIGFRRLQETTGESTWIDLGRRYLESHLAVMSRESGLLERGWHHREARPFWDPDIKGHAWVLEGYLDAYALTGDDKYLQLARALADRVMECQGTDGAWTYLFRVPQAEDPRDDKGTAIWAYFFYVLHQQTGDIAHLAAGRKALAWCLQQQYRGEDPRLDGGLLHENKMAYVQRRPMTILYSTTFLGLALIEELRLGEKQDVR